MRKKKRKREIKNVQKGQRGYVYLNRAASVGSGGRKHTRQPTVSTYLVPFDELQALLPGYIHPAVVSRIFPKIAFPHIPVFFPQPCVAGSLLPSTPD
jgi:hypothetical protein